MLDLLKTQRIKNRRLGRNSGKKSFFTGWLSGVRRKLNSSNKSGFFLLTGLLSLCLTGIVFSVVLGRSLVSDGPGDDAAAGEERQVSTMALETAYDELGAGTHAFTTRDEDIEYVMQEGDSLYSIGKLYVVDTRDLQEYNDITNPNRLKVGSKIVIPSRNNLRKFSEEREKLMAFRKQSKPAPVPLPKSLLPARATITARTKQDGPLVNASFAIETPLPEEGIYYQWDLGDGTISHNRSIDYTYLNPGTYNVSLTLKDKFGYRLETNTVTIEVSGTEGSKIVKTMYLTVGGPGEIFVLAGKVSQIEDFLGSSEKPITFVEERDNHFFYRAERSGYFYLIARSEEAVYKVYLFVSPFPSVHSDRFDVDWYRTQYDTGPSNCGPATVSMAIGWARGAFVPISAIRSYLGWQRDGGTSFNQLLRALQWKGVQAELADLSGVDDLFAAIDQGKIAIILYHSGRVSWTKGRPEYDYVGRYYSDSTGHYVVIKGYTVDKKYFVVYDPIPSDWISNGKRYGDGVSMIGRNRYYPVTEIFRALSLQKYILISR